MKYLLKKDLKHRKLFFKKEITKKIYRLIFIQTLIKKINNSTDDTSKLFIDDKQKFFFVYKYYRKMKKFSKIQIKSRCIITNRSKSVNKFFGFSRIKSRELMQFGIVPGYKKAVW